MILKTIMAVSISAVLERRRANKAPGIQADGTLSDRAVAQITDEFFDRVAKNPVAANDMNMEPLRQSRTAVYSTVAGSGGTLALIALLINEASTKPWPMYDWNAIVPLAVATLGGWLSLRGRVAAGLKPLGYGAVAKFFGRLTGGS